MIASYILNREWSFRDRGGRERHHEALLFFAFSGVGVLLSMAPLWVSSYILDFRVPAVSLTAENIADFISAYLIGNLLQMAFRFWAFRRWVFATNLGETHPITMICKRLQNFTGTCELMQPAVGLICEKILPK